MVRSAIPQRSPTGAIVRRSPKAMTRQAGLLAAFTILVLLVPVGAVSAAPHARPLGYANPAHWICRPGRNDVCGGDLSATVVKADGALAVQPLKANADAPIDCFYVYPTVSQDKSVNSDTDWGRGEELWTTYIQAAPLAGGCRLFVPGYRQLTTSGLATHVLPNDLAYGDIRAAWRYYLRHDNHGRGVILIGHSQGSWTLRKLIAEAIDDSPTVRKRLIAAYMAGFSFQVPPGADVGGDFHHVPLCRAGNQTGCVVTWSSYRATSPPPSNGLFGHPDKGTQAACTNPAALAGGSSELLAQFPATRGATITDPKGNSGRDGQWLDPAAGTVTTPFVVLPGLVSGECVHGDNGFTWLKLTTAGATGPRAADIPGDMTPEWGMHLVDMNVVMGNLQQLVATQGAAWLASHSGDRTSRRRCGPNGRRCHHR